MWARIATGKVQPGKMGDFVRIYNEIQRPLMAQTNGFRSARLLTNSTASTAIAVSIYENESDARALESGRNVEDVLKRFEGAMDGAPTFEYYEVSVDY